MDRAVSTALGALLLTALAVGLAGTAGVAVLQLTPAAAPSEPVSLSAAVEAGPDAVRLTLTHRAGPTLDVRELRLRLSVAGEPLPHQPPVPFYSAPGFGSFPSGPFNPAADPAWSVGEAAGLVLTGENAALVAPADAVVVEVSRDGVPIARATAVVR